MNMKNLVLHFENASAMCLYAMEMSGQISDGKYENSRPYHHWEWVSEISNMVVDGTYGIEGYNCNRGFAIFGQFRKKYNLNEWFSKYIKNWRKNGDTDTMWATRIIAYGKFGKIYPNLTFDQLKKFNYIEVILEDLQLKVERGETNPEVLFNKITDFSECAWREQYYESAKEFITLDFVKKFLELKYDIKECREDVKSMQNTINSVWNYKHEL